MITCCIQYTLDPHAISAFEAYAKRWPPIVERCGGKLVGYYLPKEGATNLSPALIDFASLAAYEEYQACLAEDPDARQNVADVAAARAIVSESRSFRRRA